MHEIIKLTRSKSACTIHSGYRHLPLAPDNSSTRIWGVLLQYMGKMEDIEIAMRERKIPTVTMRALATVDIAMHDWEIPTVTMRALATVDIAMRDQ